MKKGWILIVMVLALSAAKCDDGCDPEQTRCNGQVLEICNAESRWDTIADCAAIEVPEANVQYGCCMDTAEGEYACVEKEFCE